MKFKHIIIAVVLLGFLVILFLAGFPSVQAQRPEIRRAGGGSNDISIEASNFVAAASSNNVRVAAGDNITVVTSASGGIRIYTVAGNSISSDASNYVAEAASNFVRVAAGDNITVVTSSSGGIRIYTVAGQAGGSGVDSNNYIFRTNGIGYGLTVSGILTNNDGLRLGAIDDASSKVIWQSNGVVHIGDSDKAFYSMAIGPTLSTNYITTYFKGVRPDGPQSIGQSSGPRWENISGTNVNGYTVTANTVNTKALSTTGPLDYGHSTNAWAASVFADFATNNFQTIVVTNDFILRATNFGLVGGRSIAVRLVPINYVSNYSIILDSNIKRFGSNFMSTTIMLASNKIATVSLSSWGNHITNVQAAVKYEN